jgi:predicted enzyme related to lactoylglutathione lyase
MLKDAPIIPYIPVSDLARARKFYSEKVGLEPKAENNGGLTYECGGTEVFMYVSAGAGTSKASQAFWSVKDLRAEVAELRTRGVTFEEYDFPGMNMRDGIMEAEGALAAWFKDSEGNIMALIQSQ